MGRARRKNRRSRASYGGNSNSGRRNNQDRDDDFYMQGTERNHGASPAVRRGRGGYINNNSRRNSKRQDNYDGTSQDHNLPDPFASNPFDPFDDLNLDGLENNWSTRSQPRHRGTRYKRSHNHQRGHDDDHDIEKIDYLNLQGDPYAGSSRGSLPLDTGPGRGRGRGRGGFNIPIRGRGRGKGNYEDHRAGSQKSPTPPPHSPALLQHSRPQPSFARSSSLDRATTRFCTECSSVRRANLRLRDWVAAGISRASEVLDSWSDEVGVSRGSGDEMDWQPEPVVRVLIVSNSTAPSPTIPSSSVAGASFGTSYWHSDPIYGYGGPEMGDVGLGGGEVAVNYMTGSSWGLRPDALGPEFFGGSSGVWGNGGGGGMFAPKDEAYLSSGQKIDSYAGSWTRNPAFGSQTARMMTPPDTPLSMKA
ncbi:hypothetical protein F4678DRAFT_463213 [Xylaria arbuscula]|nr:hypothetical protein F4678DRAFT_463213 [Xylaria arbuscula]